MTDLTIKDLLIILRKRLIWLIILPLLAALGAGFYYGFVAKNEYTAEAKLYVLIDYMDSSGQMRYDMSSGAQFAGDYQQLVKTHEVMIQLAEQMGYATLDELESKLDIEVQAVTNTRVINLAVTSKNPVHSRDAANAMASIFVNYMRQLTKTDSVELASKAILPLVPSGPKRAQNTAIAFFGMLALVGGLALAIEMLNTTLRTDKDVEAALELPVLARIGGYHKEMQVYLKSKGKARKALLYTVSPETREDIKSLTMNLKFAANDGNIKVLALTSTAPAEGKSSLAIMLASNLAEEGNLVLMIDMDFRNPSLGAYLGTRNQRDIVDYISKKAEFDDIVSVTPVRNVMMIDSCHKDAISANVIQSNGFARLLEEAKRRYKYVILDTPPLGMFVDAAMLSKSVDGVVLVVGSGKVEREHAREVVTQLRTANANVLGVALNFVNRSTGASHYRYRKSRYYKKYYERNGGVRPTA